MIGSDDSYESSKNVDRSYVYRIDETRRDPILGHTWTSFERVGSNVPLQVSQNAYAASICERSFRSMSGVYPRKGCFTRYRRARASVGSRPSLLVHELLGAGGMGSVYKGCHSGYGVVAVKCVRAADSARIKCLENEYEATRGLRHPSVVQHHELVRYEDQAWLVMEYVAGLTLQRWLRGHNPRGLTLSTISTPARREGSVLPMRASRPRWDVERRRQVCQLFLGIAEGLEHLHAHGLVHRDLKPENVVIERRSGRPVIIDLGITARVDEATQGRYLPGGTIGYLAPELLRQTARPSVSSDWYAFGLMLYEAVTGVADQDYAVRALGGPPCAPRVRNPHLEEDLAGLCLDLLQPGVAQRAGAARVFEVLRSPRHTSCNRRSCAQR